MCGPFMKSEKRMNDLSRISFAVENNSTLLERRGKNTVYFSYDRSLSLSLSLSEILSFRIQRENQSNLLKTDPSLFVNHTKKKEKHRKYMYRVYAYTHHNQVEFRLTEMLKSRLLPLKRYKTEANTMLSGCI